MTNANPAAAATIPPIIGILFAIKKQRKTRIIDFSYSSLIIEPRMLFCQLRSIFFTDLIFLVVSISITFDR